MDGDNVDIGSLTDAQLADMLRQYGVDVGPILGIYFAITYQLNSVKHFLMSILP